MSANIVNIVLLSPEKRVEKALQLFDLMEKFVERARNRVADRPLAYDPAATCRCCQFGSETAESGGINGLFGADRHSRSPRQ